MARSGKYIYNVTAADIITEALGLVGAYAPGESIDDSEVTDALRTLNMMLKAWQPKVGLYLNKELSLFLQEDTAKYLIGPTGTHCAKDAAKTELSAAAASGATSVIIDATTGFGDTFDRDGIVTSAAITGAGSITLNGALVSSGIATMTSERKILVYSAGDESANTFSITGLNTLGVSVTEDLLGPTAASTVYSVYTYDTISSITIDAASTGAVQIGQVGDFVGIEIADGTVQWTNIGAALSTTLTLIGALTDSAAIDNHVYSYTGKTPRVIDIVEARLHKSTDYEVPLTIVGKADYMSLSNKTSSGSPNQIYYDKTLDNGSLYTWPVCNDVQEYIKFTGRMPIQNLDLTTHDFELAQEWFEAVAWNLALRLFPKYGKAIDAMIKIQAQEFFVEAKDSDNENTSVFIKVGSDR